MLEPLLLPLAKKELSLMSTRCCSCGEDMLNGLPPENGVALPPHTDVALPARCASLNPCTTAAGESGWSRGSAQLGDSVPVGMGSGAGLQAGRQAGNEQ